MLYIVHNMHNLSTMYPAKVIANFFLVKGAAEDIPISHMKLQKLVYFAHGWHLAIKETPLIDESVQAWTFGPVIPSIYHLFKYYGNQPILDVIGEISSLGVLSTETKGFLNTIWQGFKKYSAIELSEMTHALDSPWEKVIKRNGGKIIAHQSIPEDLIKDYFKQIYKANA